MRRCTCPRCAFFYQVTIELIALGDLDNATLAANEVTITLDDGTVIPPASEMARVPADEGYTDTWRDQPIPENVN